MDHADCLHKEVRWMIELSLQDEYVIDIAIFDPVFVLQDDN